MRDRIHTLASVPALLALTATIQHYDGGARSASATWTASTRTRTIGFPRTRGGDQAGSTAPGAPRCRVLRGRQRAERKPHEGRQRPHRRLRRHRDLPGRRCCGCGEATYRRTARDATRTTGTPWDGGIVELLGNALCTGVAASVDGQSGRAGGAGHGAGAGAGLTDDRSRPWPAIVSSRSTARCVCHALRKGLRRPRRDGCIAGMMRKPTRAKLTAQTSRCCFSTTWRLLVRHASGSSGPAQPRDRFA